MKIIKIIKHIFQIIISGVLFFFVWLKFFKPEKKEKQIKKEMEEIEKTIKNNDDWFDDNKPYKLNNGK